MMKPAKILAVPSGNRWLACLVLALLLSALSPAWAATATWTGTSDGNWGTAANWGGTLPTFDNTLDVTMTGSANVAPTFLGTNRTVQSLNYPSSSTTAIQIRFTTNATSGSATFTFDSASALPYINIDSGAAAHILGINNSGASVLNKNLLITNNSANAYVINRGITGTASVTKYGAGPLQLEGSGSTFDGGLNLNAGKLIFASSTAPLGTGTFTIADGTTIDTDTNQRTNLQNNAQAWNGDFTFVGTRSLDLGTGAVTMSANRQVTVSALTLTVGGIISGSGFSLTKAGAGALLLGGANTYSGLTTNNAGTLSITNGGKIYSTLGAEKANALTVNGGIVQIDNWLWDGSFGQLWAAAANIVLNGGTLQYVGTTANGSVNRMFTIGSSGATLNSASPGQKWVIMNGAYSTLNSAGGLLTLTGNGPGEIQVVIPGSGGVTKSGTGTWTLSGTNTYGGPTTISAGKLKLGHQHAVTNSTVTMAGGSLLFNSSVTANAFTFGGLAAASAGAGYDIGLTNDLGTAVALTVGGNNASTTNAGVLSGGGSLTKVGSANLTLSGTNTYTGATTVNGGTLVIINAATIATNSTVTVTNGAVLNLGFATTNRVGALVLNGVSQPNGVYGASTPGGYLAGTGKLQVASQTIVNYPTNITFSVTVNTLNLSWPATHLGWLVQSNSVNLAVTNYWFDIAGTGAGTNYSITIDSAKTNVFYRLRSP